MQRYPSNHSQQTNHPSNSGRKGRPRLEPRNSYCQDPSKCQIKTRQKRVPRWHFRDHQLCSRLVTLPPQRGDSPAHKCLPDPRHGSLQSCFSEGSQDRLTETAGGLRQDGQASARLSARRRRCTAHRANLSCFHCHGRTPAPMTHSRDQAPPFVFCGGGSDAGGEGSVPTGASAVVTQRAFSRD